MTNFISGQDTENTQALYTSGYTNQQLAGELADQISLRTDDADRVDFLDEFNEAPDAGWMRADICRALDDHGVTPRAINRRKS